MDPFGFVNTTNACNFFIVRKGEVWTSTGDYCLNGITRGDLLVSGEMQHGGVLRQRVAADYRNIGEYVQVFSAQMLGDAHAVETL